MECFKCNEEVSVVKTIQYYEEEMDEMTFEKFSFEGIKVCEDCYEEMEESDKYTIE